MSYSTKTRNLTDAVKTKASKYGFDQIGIASAETLDSIPSHYIAHRDYKLWTKKTKDYMVDARSLIILGLKVWDNIFDVVIKVGDQNEYPDEWRGRLYSRR